MAQLPIESVSSTEPASEMSPCRDASSAAWKVLYAAQRTHTVAVSGPYARIRHPQYVGFILIMLGFLLQIVEVSAHR